MLRRKSFRSGTIRRTGGDVMRRRTALGGVIVAASLAVAGSASAQTATWALWKNANTTNGTFYMGVSGGPKCNASRQCWVNPGTQIITWTQSQGDQYMGAIENFPPGTTIQDFYKDSSGNPMCLQVAGNSQSTNANIVVSECQNRTQSPSQFWQAASAEDLGAPFPGCFMFFNMNSPGVTLMVLSVFQGSVKDGSRVIQFPICEPTSGGNTCGFPPNAWHPDQFWCPIQPTIIP
jgi:hypothetical protein